MRLLCTQQGTPKGFSLADFEVYGSGGPAKKPKVLLSPAKDGNWDLCGGWKLVSRSFATEDPTEISTSGYDDSKWLAATVPGTVLTSYLNLGAIPDPFYGDKQYQVSDWFCRCDWWYRTEVELPESYRGNRVWLNLDGINYKAEVYVNGGLIGKIAGAFIRGRFDITEKAVVGPQNCIAVLIHPMPQSVRAGRQTARQDVHPRRSSPGKRLPSWNRPNGIGYRRFAIATSASGTGFSQHQRRSNHCRSICHQRTAVAARYVAGRPDREGRVDQPFKPAAQRRSAGEDRRCAIRAAGLAGRTRNPDRIHRQVGPAGVIHS